MSGLVDPDWDDTREPPPTGLEDAAMVEQIARDAEIDVHVWSATPPGPDAFRVFREAMGAEVQFGVPDEPVRERPIAATVPKRERTRLAKAELLAKVATAVEVMAVRAAHHPNTPLHLDPDRPSRPDLVGVVDLCHRYALTPTDIGRLLHRVASELETRATNLGIEEAWL